MANPRSFTPGPWFVHPGSSSHNVQVRVQRTDKPEFEITVATCGGWGTTAALNAGNAALIAIAPELFSALEALTEELARAAQADHIYFSPVLAKLMQDGMTVLAKATGGAK